MIRRIALPATWLSLMTVHIGFAQQPAVIPAAQLQPAVPATVVQPAATQQPAATLQPAQAAAETTEATVDEATEPKDDAAVEATANETADASADEASNAASSDEDAAAKAKQAALDAKIEAEKTKLKTERTQFKQQRLQQIKQLQFDRRMSSALQLWSTPDADKVAAEKEAEEKRLEAEAKAKAQAAEAADDSAAPAAEELPAEVVQLRTDFEAEKKAFTESLQAFQEAVTLGQWDEVKQFLASLEEEEEQDAALNQLLTSLAAGPAGPQMPTADQMPLVDPAVLAAAMAARGQGPGARFRETNFFALADIEGLLQCCPDDLEDAQIMRLGQIIRQSITAGHDVDSLVRRFEEEVKKPSESHPIVNKRLAAKLLFAAGQSQHTGNFLPTADEAVAANDREGLNLLARYAYDAYRTENKKELLVQAWEATQAVLAAGEVDPEEKNEALKRAVELAPKVAEEMGQAWLDESFTKRMERGKEILGTIGSTAATAMQTRPTDAQYRLKILQLQKTAVDALIQAAPDLAQDWQEQLNLLAMNWLKEAEYTQQQAQTSSMNAMLRRDIYGNYYYSEDYDYNSRRMSGQSSPIETPDMLENRPTDDWLALLSPSIQPKFQMIFAQLYLKVNEEEKAFPFIEAFAQSQPEKALDLAHEFLRVWTENHNPNQNRGRTNYYMFMYGYDQRADQIPLTRSKQERNLKELAEWIQRLKALPIGELDEELLVRAFKTSHSSAEVYRLETMEKVFGKVDSLKPETLAEMIQQMRTNLATIWRDPAEQKNQKTNRTKTEMLAEVARGYEVAKQVLDVGLEKYGDDWRMMLAKACVEYDQNDFQQEQQKSSEYAEKRAACMQLFRDAALRYIQTLAELEQEDEETEAFEFWYYASLGAVDLGRISEKSKPDLTQPAVIRETLQSIPGDAADRHLGMFANSLFTRMSSLKPEMKFRYLRTGFEIVGDHKQAAEAKKVFDYYKDLVTEIRLEARVDGSTNVGHAQPFGLFVDLVHTTQIERESGGFGKYLQNQNNMYYSYNYGRPTENYRDKFEEAATEALKERFEVLSVTFNDPEVTSSATSEFGWRKTPYAYVLLKPRGPEVDMIPSLHIDLDFLDTSGYAIIPVESASIPIDAKSEAGEARPFENLKVVQTLDERQAKDGKLILEVKANSHGLLPDLEKLVQMDLEKFDVQNIDDQGLSVDRFDPEAANVAVSTERTWLITMRSKPELKTAPDAFQFPSVIPATQEVSYQRYVDADLEEVESAVRLKANYDAPNRWWFVPLIAGSVLGLLAILLAVYLLTKKSTVTVQQGLQLPDVVTPFTVLGLLKQIEAKNGFNDAKRKDLAHSIQQIEQHYFVDESTEPLQLEEIASHWLQQSA